MQSRMMILSLVFLALGAAATPVQKAKEASLIQPELKDKASDKKFFGPPFPADYPEDKRPVVQKHILDKLKSPDQPYPALQSKKDFDEDFVKDENSDKGHWKAQFEYDALRRKLVQEEADEKSAQARADKEGRDVDDAQKKADDAGKKAADAEKAVADSKKSGSSSKDPVQDAVDDSLPPSKESLERMKKRVEAAEANYEKEKKEFEECKRKLEESKQRVEDLKVKMASMEAQLQGETKLWVESKALKLQLHDAKVQASTAKYSAAVARLKVTQDTKADFDRVLAKEKAESVQAEKALAFEKDAMQHLQKNFAKATVRLQRLKGYKPADKLPAKSNARMTSALLCLVAAAMQALF